MDETRLKAGDIVHIKSGSPRMVVASVAKGCANCVYYTYGSGEVREVKIPLSALERK